ncbi:membrane protein of unknown function [Vibrio tapetis subsp. tapetis]|uniref:Acyltransferase 3 domain-containing protein n=1 Tax=Vibrio tapetis subsp. tapetis TaxID=1671868 RepID=A0A2N8ZLK6_9VIBR|nr:membrane protein of unknown function [Vibrio tapetis subsp. tapetis]
MNYISYNFEFSQGLKYVTRGDWLGHLWFLGNLIIYFIISSPICKSIKTNSKKTLTNLLMFALSFLIISVFIRSNFNDLINKRFIFVTLSPLVYFYAYFVIGISLKHSNKNLFTILSIRLTPLYFIIYMSLYYFSLLDVLSYDVKTGPNFLELLSRFPLVLCVISILNFIGNVESDKIRVLSNANYTIYLLHEPLIVVQYFYIFKEVSLNIYIEYIFMVSITCVVSFTTHQYIVKRFNITKFLFNGIPFNSIKSRNIISSHSSSQIKS